MTDVKEHLTFDCSVCGNKSKFYHLNAEICSRCSSFYRRTIREDLKYQCESSERCQQGRCRFCRFAKCQELGAEFPSTTVSLTSNHENPSNTPKYSILNTLMTGYDRFLESQKALICIVHPEILLKDDMVITLKKRDRNEIQEKCIPLLVDMFNTYYGPFKHLTIAQKKQLVLDTHNDTEKLNSAYLTSRYFPGEDTRLMDSLCTYVDFNPQQAQWFFEGHVKQEEDNGHLKALKFMMEKMLKHAVKYKQLKLSKMDTVALMLLSIWKRIERNGWITNEMIEYREMMLVEWSKQICQEHGRIKGPQRLTSIMHLFYESDNVAAELTNFVLVQQVKLNKSRDEFVCGILEKMQNLDLGDSPQI